ncbi:signal peptidase II [Amycolatopsis endophytica]|uniref:Lipoprotein signal peptidase n=1 Tax=Amycolatopsis endophytica TaxID=860233 RepID=A0A853BBU7_9PSEU|nr:signal peptidase II [Amycolatopsis endophytica]NYI92838.1 signal peptidase II [Amycolatopsis endophytica]
MSSDSQPSPDTVPDEQPVDPPQRRSLLLALIAVVVLALDIVTKSIVVATLEGHEPVRLLGGFVYLQLIRNPFAAFGMGPTGMTWIFGIVAIGVVVALIWFAGRLRSVGWAIGLGLILAGAAGNLTDRLFRAPGVLRGHVVDFISVFAPNGDVWPVFNVADSAICVGGVLIVLLSLLGREYDGTVKGKAKR